MIGDALMDITARIDSPITYASDTPARISQQPGGSGANTAAWLAASGGRVTFIGSAGDDAFGASLTGRLAELGVDVQVSRTSDAPTGTCIVIVDAIGERTMFPDPGANTLLSPAFVASVLESGYDHLHVSGYTLFNEGSRAAGIAAIQTARHVGCTVSLDTASSGPLEGCRDVVLALLPQVDVVLANAAEAVVLSGRADPDLALAVLGAGAGTVVVKRGPLGAVGTRAGTVAQVPARPVDVVDTTGAGDAFGAGFLLAWLAGSPLDEAQTAGTATAAAAVTRVGAGPPHP